MNPLSHTVGYPERRHPTRPGYAVAPFRDPYYMGVFNHCVMHWDTKGVLLAEGLNRAIFYRGLYDMDERLTMSKAGSEDDGKRYRFGYRIHIKQEGDREAIELSSAMNDGDPATLDEIEACLKEEVERAVDNFKREPAEEKGREPK